LDLPRARFLVQVKEERMARSHVHERISSCLLYTGAPEAPPSAFGCQLRDIRFEDPARDLGTAGVPVGARTRSSSAFASQQGSNCRRVQQRADRRAICGCRGRVVARHEHRDDSAVGGSGSVPEFDDRAIVSVVVKTGLRVGVAVAATRDGFPRANERRAVDGSAGVDGSSVAALIPACTGREDGDAEARRQESKRSHPRPPPNGQPCAERPTT
jgi:hypothetical protein